MIYGKRECSEEDSPTRSEEKASQGRWVGEATIFFLSFNRKLVTCSLRNGQRQLLLNTKELAEQCKTNFSFEKHVQKN